MTCGEISALPVKHAHRRPPPALQEAAAAAPLTPPPAKKIRGGLSPADSGPESPFAPSPLSSFPGHGGGAVAEEAEPQIKRWERGGTPELETRMFLAADERTQ